MTEKEKRKLNEMFEKGFDKGVERTMERISSLPLIDFIDEHYWAQLGKDIKARGYYDGSTIK